MDSNRKLLREAVLRVFDSAQLKQTLREGSPSRNLDVLVSPSADFDKQVFQLIDRADQEGWLKELIGTLITVRHGNASFMAVIRPIADRLTAGQPLDDVAAETEAETPRTSRLTILLASIRRQPKWILAHWRMSVTAVIAIALSVDLIWLVWPPRTNPNEPLIPVHAPHVWSKAFVVRGERLAYASPDTTYEVLEGRLSKAQKSILMAVNSFASPEVKAMVLNAVDRDVKVSLIQAFNTGSSNKPQSFFYEFIKKGADVVDAGNRAAGFFTYNPRVIIIDGKWALIQTGNLTPTGVPPPQQRAGNRDVGIAIESPELADYFTDLIEHDKALIKHAAASNSPDFDRKDPPPFPVYEPMPRFPVYRAGGETQPGQNPKSDGGVRPIRVLPVHAPDNYAKYVSELLASARASIDIALPYIIVSDDSPTLQKLLDAIGNARSSHRNLRFRIILSKFSSSTQLKRLLNVCPWLLADDIRKLNPRTGLHLDSKLLIIDRRVSIVSSANWSESQVSNWRQVGVIVDAPDIAEAYLKIFDADWERALPVNVTDDSATDD